VVHTAAGMAPKPAANAKAKSPRDGKSPRGTKPTAKKKAMGRTVTRGANQALAPAVEEEAPEPDVEDRNEPLTTFTPGNFVFDNPGRKLTDDYDCDQKDQLGEGGYGVVFKASIKGNPDAVRAVKKIRKELVKNLRALRQEIEVMKSADHPNIVKLYESFEDAKHIYLVMELCEGGELFDRIIEAGHFSEEQTAHCMRQLLRAVRFLHDQRICHRDLKPENLIFVKNKPPEQTPMKLIDFGLAEHVPEGKHLKEQKGSLYYMAPEVLRRRYGIEIDVWTCGIIMFIMLSGYPPFYGDDDDSTYMAIQKDPLTFRPDYWAQRPDDQGGPISEDAMDFIRHMCERDIKTRWTAVQCVDHPWIQRAKLPFNTKLTPEYLGRLADYISPTCPLLKRAAFQLIVNRLSEKEIKEFKDLFLTLDQDGDGYVVAGDVAAKAKDAGLEADPSLSKIIAALGPARLPYTEFMAAVCDQKRFATELNVISAFRVFDRRNENKINEEVLGQIFHDPTQVMKDAKEVGKAMMKDHDTNKDGFLDIAEFKALVTGVVA